MDKNDAIDIMKKEQEVKTCTTIGILNSRLDSVNRYFLLRKYNKIVLLGKNSAADSFINLIENTSIEATCVDSIDEIQELPDVILVSSEFHYDRICRQLREQVSVPIFLLDDIVTDICWTPCKLGNKGLREYEEEQIRTVNLYDQREKQHLYKILPKDRYIGKQRIEKVLDKKAVVIANLYYIADTDMYLQYLCKLPKAVDIYIVTSNINVYDYANSKIKKNKWNNITILRKINRGRDISALLVACRDILPKYDYICFVHDKREKLAITKKDGDFWIENLWENTIASTEYLANIFNEFDTSPQLGLLVPPEPAGMYQNAWYKFSWNDCFTLTEKLAEALELNCPLSINKPPITLGTAFWCRYEALKKLFEKEWKYTSFPEEPLPDDGTISHSIERILGYVAQDAGYKTSIVMNNEYAAKLFSLLQVNLQKIFECLYPMYHILSFQDTNRLYNLMERLLKIFDKYQNIYLYGAGKVGMYFLTQLERFDIYPKAFIETECEEGKQIKNIPVYSIDTIELNDNDAIIISVGYKLRSEILQELEKRNIVNYFFCQDLY